MPLGEAVRQPLRPSARMAQNNFFFRFEKICLDAVKSMKKRKKKSDGAIWRRPAPEVAAAFGLGLGGVTSRTPYAVADGRVIAVNVSNW